MLHEQTFQLSDFPGNSANAVDLADLDGARWGVKGLAAKGRRDPSGSSSTLLKHC
jgi:hypothetical protein